jgi:hypothetical protein
MWAGENSKALSLLVFAIDGLSSHTFNKSSNEWKQSKAWSESSLSQAGCADH